MNILEIAVTMIAIPVLGWYLLRVESTVRSVQRLEVEVENLKTDVLETKGAIEKQNGYLGDVQVKVGEIHGMLSVLLRRRRSDRELKEHGIEIESADD